MWTTSSLPGTGAPQEVLKLEHLTVLQPGLQHTPRTQIPILECSPAGSMYSPFAALMTLPDRSLSAETDAQDVQVQ